MAYVTISTILWGSYCLYQNQYFINLKLNAGLYKNWLIWAYNAWYWYLHVLVFTHGAGTYLCAILVHMDTSFTYLAD